MADLKLVNGTLNVECKHGYTSWRYCNACCAGLANMVPWLLREIDTLRAQLDKKTPKKTSRRTS